LADEDEKFVFSVTIGSRPPRLRRWKGAKRGSVAVFPGGGDVDDSSERLLRREKTLRQLTKTLRRLETRLRQQEKTQNEVNETNDESEMTLFQPKMTLHQRETTLCQPKMTLHP
jgi:hypothetical protein